MDNFRRNLTTRENFDGFAVGDRNEPKPTSSAGARRLAEQKSKTRRAARRAQKASDRRDARRDET